MAGASTLLAICMGALTMVRDAFEEREGHKMPVGVIHHLMRRGQLLKLGHRSHMAMGKPEELSVAVHSTGSATRKVGLVFLLHPVCRGLKRLPDLLRQPASSHKRN